MYISVWVAIKPKVHYLYAETGVKVSRGTKEAKMRTVKILAQESAHTYACIIICSNAYDTGTHGLIIQLIMGCKQVSYAHHILKDAWKIQNRSASAWVIDPLCVQIPSTK